MAWNCRGLGSPLAISNLKNLLSGTNTSILFLSETRCHTNRAAEIANAIMFDHVCAIPPIISGGGIAMFWNSHINLTVLQASNHYIIAQIDEELNKWILCGVYGASKREDRVTVWVEICNQLSNYSLPLCCIGDFNSILNQSEKLGGRELSYTQNQDFRDFLNNLKLMDLGYSGAAYTWANNRQSQFHIRERLDRTAVNVDWRIAYPNAAVRHLPRIWSDHSPILLSLIRRRRYSIRQQFKYEEYWHHQDGFEDVFYNSWNPDRPILNSVDFHTKCNIFKSNIFVWSRKSIVNFRSKLKDLEVDIASIQKKWPNEDSIRKEANLIATYKNIQWQENLYWRQRAKSHWLAENDCNTRYFHAAVLNRRRRNQIFMVKDESGSQCTNHQEIRAVFIRYFSCLFTSENPPPIDESQLHMEPSICESDNQFLTAIPSELEIKKSLFSIGNLKAPGPDGLSAGFFKNFWSSVKGDIIRYVTSSFEFNYLPDYANYTNIALIPKKKIADVPEAYRPISLCNVIYKIIAKIIANRLRKVIGKCISPNQNAFIPSRQIVDNSAIVHEALNTMARTTGSCGYFALKIDMAKAYDRIEWSFLLNAMKLMGFSTYFISLIRTCISSARFAVIINGNPEGDIIAQRGIRQGCPLSPFLFLIASEILSKLFHQQALNANIRGIKFGRRGMAINHIMFADDLFLFGRATTFESMNIKNILATYGKCSGQCINLQKSAIHFSKNLSISKKEDIKRIFLIREMIGSELYLGGPLFVGRAKSKSFNFLVDKFKGKLKGWKADSLSHTGRSVLIQSSLASIPPYFMSTNIIPKNIIDKLHGIMRDFWWGFKNSCKHLYLKRWKDFFKAKCDGGLGFRDLELVNRSYIMKLGWKILSDTNNWWVKIIRNKYMRHANFWECKVQPYNSSLWKAILNIRQDLRKGVCWQVGNGTSINIFSDPWIPSLQDFCLSPNSLSHGVLYVSDLILNNNSWNFQLLTDLGFDPIISNHITRIRLPRDIVTMDRLIWTGHPKGIFSIGSAYKNLKDSRGESSAQHNNNKIWISLWKVKNLLPKIHMFIWRLLSGCLATREAIASRIPSIDPSCVLCGEAVESVTHLFLFCKEVRLIWFASSLQLHFHREDWDMRQWIRTFLQISTNDYHIFKCVANILWHIWKGRNAKLFDNKDFNAGNILLNIRSQPFTHDHSVSALGVDVVSSSLVESDLWLSPPNGYVKLNVDAAVRSDHISVGVMVRDCNGHVCACSGKRHPPCSPLEAETLAILHAFHVVQHIGYPHAIVESDNQSIISILNSVDPSPPWRIFMLVQECRSMLSSIGDVKLSFISRNLNYVAHNLAKLISICKLDSLDGIPDCIHMLLEPAGVCEPIDINLSPNPPYC